MTDPTDDQTYDNRAMQSFEIAISAVSRERDHQDAKWGPLHAKRQTIEGYLLIIEAELQEAKTGWMKNKTGRHSALAEIVQVAAVAVACLQQHGVPSVCWEGGADDD